MLEQMCIGVSKGILCVTRLVYLFQEQLGSTVSNATPWTTRYARRHSCDQSNATAWLASRMSGKCRFQVIAEATKSARSYNMSSMVVAFPGGINVTAKNVKDAISSD